MANPGWRHRRQRNLTLIGHLHSSIERLRTSRLCKSRIVRNLPTQLLMSGHDRASIGSYLYRGLAHTPNVVDPTRMTKQGASLFGHGACRFVRTSHPGQKVPTLQCHGSQQIAWWHFGGGIFTRVCIEECDLPEQQLWLDSEQAVNHHNCGP